MAKELNTKCKCCGGPVEPGCDFCSHGCKRKGPAKVEKSKKDTTTDKDKE